MLPKLIDGKPRIERLNLAIADLLTAHESLEDARRELRRIGMEEESVRIASGYVDIRHLNNAVEALAESLEKRADCPDCGHKLSLHTPCCGEAHAHKPDCYDAEPNGKPILTCGEKEGPCSCAWAGVLA